MESNPLTPATPDPMSVDRLTEAVQVLEVLANASMVRFERMTARQVLNESLDATGGDDAEGWARRLVEVGDSVGLRVRRIECRFDEVVTVLRQGLPVAAWVSDPETGWRWWVFTGAKGRKIAVHDTKTGVQQRRTFRQVRHLLGLATKTSTAPWIFAQAALPQSQTEPHEHDQNVSAHHVHASHHHDISPVSRLWKQILMERRDLTAVLVFSIVVGTLALATPIAVEALVNTVAFGRYVQPVVVLAILLFTFLSFSAAIRVLATYVVEILQRRLFVRTVEDLAYRLPRMQREQLDNRHGPELVNRFFDIVTVQKATSTLLLDGVNLVLQTAIGMIVLAFYHPFLLGFDLFLLCFVGFVVFVLGRGAVRTSIQESRSKYAVASWLQEISQHVSAFKLNGGLGFALDRADRLTMDYLEARRLHFRILLRQLIYALSLQAIASTALLGLGGWLVIQGQLTLGQLVASELIVMVIVGSFAKMGKHLESYYDLAAAMDKLGHLFDLAPEPQDKLFHLRDVGAASLILRGVSYHYPCGNVGFEGLDLAVPSGDRVAVTGPAGAGKSTMIDLICGVRTPSHGHIELDGIDLREIRPDSLREHLGVARAIEIFPGTIGENVHLHRSQVNFRDVRDALEMVDLLDEALRFPGGLNTELAHGGAPLSSSQAARLMLARAIVARPRLLLIDGLLDSLSDELQDRVLERIAASNAPWTLVLVTGRQRLSKWCQRVIRLNPAAAHGAKASVSSDGFDSDDFNEIAVTDCR
jgi:ABC-type bacteriocin/lantibiotic exporter with double-glycine peptidase domain